MLKQISKMFFPSNLQPVVAYAALIAIVYVYVVAQPRNCYILS